MGCCCPCPMQNVLAKMVIDRVPSVEMVRFVSSGTEACLSVLRLMRAYTKREKVRMWVVKYTAMMQASLLPWACCRLLSMPAENKAIDRRLWGNIVEPESNT